MAVRVTRAMVRKAGEAHFAGDGANGRFAKALKGTSAFMIDHLTEQYADAKISAGEIIPDTDAEFSADLAVAVAYHINETWEAPKCGCGCGAEVTSTYLQGHDAKHKSALVKAALAGSVEARETLEDKGWTKFLDAARAPKTREAKAVQGDARAASKLDRIAAMKAVAKVLKAQGDTTTKVTPDNYEALALGLGIDGVLV